MTENYDVKKGIAKMYSIMGRNCQRQAEAIENVDGYIIDDLKIGCKFSDNGKTYLLICELKELSE